MAVHTLLKQLKNKAADSRYKLLLGKGFFCFLCEVSEN